MDGLVCRRVHLWFLEALLRCPDIPTRASVVGLGEPVFYLFLAKESAFAGTGRTAGMLGLKAPPDEIGQSTQEADDQYKSQGVERFQSRPPFGAYSPVL